MKPESASQHPTDNRVVHQYDDTQEYDNHLPNWWLYTLYGTVAFAIAYWFAYHVFAAAELPMQTYRREADEYAARTGKAAPVSAEMLRELSRDGAIVAEGKQVFAANCAPCHAVNGGGNIGPNLTDAYWIHGGAPDQIYKSVSEGYATKGMPAWVPQLGGARVRSVAAFMLTLQNTNVAGGKAPQGDKDGQPAPQP